jgi:2-phospho-L-lactate/phosphoenolpyruvate guanylyltransferase
VRTLAVVPIKTFEIAKQRLAGALPPGSRESLAQAMCADVLGALRRSRRVDSIAVVTADPTADSLALGLATVVRDHAQAGQSAAAELGIAHALREGFERVLLVPGDTPLMDPAELDALLDRVAGDGLALAIVGDRHGTGTNALLLSPPDAMQPSFGPESLARHAAAAEAAKLLYRVEDVPSLAHDVDTPEDLAALAALLAETRLGAPRTRGALRQLERSGFAAVTAGSGGSRPSGVTA